MKPIILWTVSITLFWSSIICRGNTALNNEQREFLMVQSAILQYQKDTNEFPSSWDDLWNNKASLPSVEWLDQGKSFGRRTDMIESFRFIAPGTAIVLPTDGSRVIGMMTRPMRPPPETRRRFLIVELKDGTRGLKQIEEDGLKTLFSKAGFDLANYTGPNGNWAPETRLKALSDIQPPPKTVLLDPAMDHSTIPAFKSPERIHPEREKPSSSFSKKNFDILPKLWIGLVAILLVCAAFGIKHLRR